MRKVVLCLVILGLVVGGVFAQEVEKANIRIAHLSSDAGDVDIYLNTGDTNVSQDTYSFGDVSEWMDVAPDTYTVTVVPTEGTMEDAIVETELDVEAGDWVTVAAIGEVEKETVALQTLVEDYSPLGPFQSRLSVFHALPNFDPVNIFVNDVELIRYLGYPGFWGPDSDGFITFDILAKTSDIRLEQIDETVVVELDDIVLGGNRHYFLAIAGTPDDPQYVFIPADLEPVPTEE
jgi:hypothetical protein